MQPCSEARRGRGDSALGTAAGATGKGGIRASKMRHTPPLLPPQVAGRGSKEVGVAALGSAWAPASLSIPAAPGSCWRGPGRRGEQRSVRAMPRWLPSQDPCWLAWCPSRGEDATLPKVSGGASTPLLLQVMPQFTFACFCGLHGFCKMKRKKEESSAEQETAV
ncbi:bladder cancer associated transcript 1 isoform X1 [Phalacrocorax aristotelis]|uniref:bladder cancer associated transcript 1 isoform X1 n=1 Tax=Phalacrocorax aristotelis TaxID=126867 RepID=UPI003F4BCEC3